MGRNWVITIGINSYRNLQRLHYAKRDAEAMQTFFCQDLHFDQLYHFSDDSPPIPQDYGDSLDSHPTFATLRRFLRVRFEAPFLGDGDNLWFFFAGHGMRYEDRDYLMPLDGDPGDVSSTAIPLHYVTERLRRCGADNVILLIDACRSASGRRDGVGVGEEKQQGVITLFSCSPRESSYEINELQQGAFTHALLASLRLQGEENCATVERLYQRLRSSVPALSQRYQKPQQTPYGFIEPPTKYHLILLPQQATASDILALKNDAYRAESGHELAQAKQLWTRVLAIASADSEAIKGIERLARVSAMLTTPAHLMVPLSAAGTCQIDEPPSQSTGLDGGQDTSAFGFDWQLLEFEVAALEQNLEQQQVGSFRNLFQSGEQRIWTIRRQRHQRVGLWVEPMGNGVVLEMLLLPGGAFVMGSPENESARTNAESPKHKVNLESFMLGRYPVTQAQWRAVAAMRPVSRELKPNPSQFKGDKKPVEQVSWYDAVEFCNRLSAYTNREYRLPTEAEWEYACRAGTKTPFHFGETLTNDLANYDSNYTYNNGPKGRGWSETTLVDQFKIANAFGLCDMHGNVWEWCQDHWHKNYEGAPTDGSVWLSEYKNTSRVRRGGSWIFIPGICRSASRGSLKPDNHGNTFGFRVACSP